MPPRGFLRRPVLGLAMGGGGARGLAHIGVLKVFEREGVAVDLMAGTSMGGIVAALYASGLSAEALETEALRMTRLGEIVRLIDWALPRRSLLTWQAVSNYLSQWISGEATFEGLSIPIALTAVDVQCGVEVVLTRGPLLPAVEATMALPGILEPVELEGMELIDGGVLNNVPADIVRRMGAEVVIAIDVSVNVHDPDAWEKGGLPGVVRDMWRADTITIAALTEAKLRQAEPEILLRPELPAEITTMTGFSRAEEVIAAGEVAALQALARMKRALRPSLRLPWHRRAVD